MFEFKSISQLCESLRIPQSRIGFGWRLTDTENGEINGLPSSRGTRVATDGIRCIIVQGEDKLFFGHENWFVPDEPLEQTANNLASSGTKKSRSRMETFFNKFDQL